MNAKLCKILRRLDEYNWKDARYSHREYKKVVRASDREGYKKVIEPSEEGKVLSENEIKHSHTVVTSVLLPECGRATYRRAKKYARELKKTPLV